ncbi:MAG: chorismate synthase [Rubripirellula sp.]|jgi:chorismate synthase|nr:chorismate synthase [Rubripirellula sp.]
MEILGGPLFGAAGAGESHGPAVTTIIFGCPAGHYLKRDEIQTYLDRRRPGGNRHGTPRNEKDKVVLLSGLYQSNHNLLLGNSTIAVEVDGQRFETEGFEEGFTTGEPISAIVLSTSKKSGDYTQFEGAEGEVRPGHTDLVKFHKSFGFVDIRGGGRSSYRATISDVIAGSVARSFLRHKFGTFILSSICQVGNLHASETLSTKLSSFGTLEGSAKYDIDQIASIESQLNDSEIHSIDSRFASEAAELIKETRKAGDSIGAAVEVVAVNVPPLLGDPLYQSLKLKLMGSLGGLNAAESCEIGDGIQVIHKLGSENNDPIRAHGYISNSHGGLLGGITTGMPVVCRVGFKPTSTINLPQKSVKKNLQEIEFELKKGRHDPCVGVRAGVTLESRMAIELLNAAMMQQAKKIDSDLSSLF